MGILNSLAQANAGVTALATAKSVSVEQQLLLQNQRLIEQNDEIISLLGQVARSTDFLARMEQAKR